MNKYPRKNGTATKKPGFFKRLIKGIIPWKGDGASVIVRKVIFIIALIVFIATAAPLVFDVYLMYRDEWRSKGISDIYIPNGQTNEGRSKEILPAFKELLEINPETVGYIRIEGTKIDYPVVKGKDNDYYLDHDFYGEESKSGTIMMDYRCEMNSERNSSNMVLYGHNMGVGTFFAGLGEYWRTLYDSYDTPSISFYKEHPVIIFDTLYEQAKWKVFAVGLYNTEERYGEVFNYTGKHDFASREDFNDYIINIMDRSDIFTDVDIEYGDEILTLSTCIWPWRSDMDNVRLAVFARKIRSGESEYVDVEKAEKNTYVKRWKWVYDYISDGYDWAQSNWDRRKLLSYTEEDAEKDGYTFKED